MMNEYNDDDDDDDDLNTNYYNINMNLYFGRYIHDVFWLV